jgi:hypothetical protein
MRRGVASRVPLLAAVATWVVFHASGHAQSTLFEPKSGYYKARGVGVKAAWAVDRATVPEDGAVVATLTVRNAANPTEIVRPELAKLDDFAARFQVEDVPAPPPKAGATEVAFAYRLRPRNRGVDRLPSLDFYYLNPAVKTGNPFERARAVGVALVVTAAAPKPRPPAVPLDAPDHLLTLETGPRVLEGPPFTPGPVAWAALVAGAVLTPVGWYLGWRWVYPDAARLAKRRRTRAARRALAAVRAAPRSPDPAGACAAAVLGYLRERFPLPPGADTPPEVASSLAAAGAPTDAAGAAVAFLRACDAARFAAAGDTAASLPADAAALVARLEAVG